MFMVTRKRYSLLPIKIEYINKELDYKCRIVIPNSYKLEINKQVLDRFEEHGINYQLV